MAVGSSSPVLTSDVGALPTQRPRSISLIETQVLYYIYIYVLYTHIHTPTHTHTHTSLMETQFTMELTETPEAASYGMHVSSSSHAPTLPTLQAAKPHRVEEAGGAEELKLKVGAGGGGRNSPDGRRLSWSRSESMEGVKDGWAGGGKEGGENGEWITAGDRHSSGMPNVKRDLV
jgi:hypothetical protein